MARVVRRATTAVFVLLFGLVAPAIGQSAAAQPIAVQPTAVQPARVHPAAQPIAAAPLAHAQPAEAAAPASPADVEIPYLDVASIEPAPPWRIADCAPVVAASPLVTGCEATRITLAAPEYDPDAGVTVLQVPLTNDAVATTVGYRVRLAGPEAPTAAPDPAPWPVAAGSLLRLPIAELGVECVMCAAGGRLEALEVKPAAAGSAWATPTHLVFRAAAGYSGSAEVRFVFADDYGTDSAAGTVHAAVYRASATPLIALDWFAALDGEGRAAIDLASLVASVGGEDPILVGCGAPMHGRVRCDEASAVFTGDPNRLDQFTVQFAADGEQATATVTVVPEASERPTSGPVPLAPPEQESGVTTWLTPPVPVEHHDTSGIFSPLAATLDRVGAR